MNPTSNDPYKDLTHYPAEKPTGRKRFRYTDNTTPSTETIFNKLPSSPTKISQYVENRAQFEEGEIDTHVDMKIKLFIINLGLVKGTPFHFEIGHTHSQGPSAKPVKFEHDGKIYRETLHAVHSSALPALLVQDRQEWKLWKNNEGPKPKQYTFAKQSIFDRNQNSTRELPAEINRADIRFEGKNNQNLLRNKIIRIINLVAKEKLTIHEGLNSFLKKYEKIIINDLEVLKNKEIKNLSSQKKVERDIEISEIYLRAVQHHKRYAEDPRYVVNVFEIQEEIQKLQKDGEETIVNMKCNHLRRSAGIESRIHHEVVSPTGKAVLGKRKRSPHNFNSALIGHFFEAARASNSEKAKQILLNQYFVSEEQIQAFGDTKQAFDFLHKKHIDLTEKIRKLEICYDELMEINRNYNKEILSFVMEKKELEKEDLLEIYNTIDKITEQELNDILEGKANLYASQAKVLAEILCIRASDFLIEPDPQVKTNDVEEEEATTENIAEVNSNEVEEEEEIVAVSS